MTTTTPTTVTTSPSSTTTTAMMTNAKEPSVSGTQIALSVIGAVVGVVLLAGMGYCFYLHRCKADGMSMFCVDYWKL